MRQCAAIANYVLLIKSYNSALRIQREIIEAYTERKEWKDKHTEENMNL